MENKTVKSISIKEGTNEKGPWKNTLITCMDGAKIGTFEETPSHLKEGDEFEFEPSMKGDKVNIKKGTFKVTKSAAPTAPAPGSSGQPAQPSKDDRYKRDTEGIRFEYDLKAWMQQVDRVSIESQTVFNRVMETLPHLPEIKLEAKVQKSLNDLIEKAIKWGGARFDEQVKKAPEPKPADKKEKPALVTGKGESVDPEHPFPHVGALLNWCAEQHINRAKFMEIIRIKEADLPRVNIRDAHESIRDWLKEHPVDPADPDRIFQK